MEPGENWKALRKTLQKTRKTKTAPGFSKIQVKKSKPRHESVPVPPGKSCTRPSVGNIIRDHKIQQTTDGSFSNRDRVGRYVAIDCEMVGVGGADSNRSALARVSLVNYHGTIILDRFVLPKERVTDWRTRYSGISPGDLDHAEPFERIQEQVADIIKEKILIGHAVHNDLRVLLLGHPKKDIRDTSTFEFFRRLCKSKKPSLKRLANDILGKSIQTAGHSSLVDAEITMELYRKYKKDIDTGAMKKSGIKR